jgi:hypothetical protein
MSGTGWQCAQYALNAYQSPNPDGARRHVKHNGAWKAPRFRLDGFSSSPGTTRPPEVTGGSNLNLEPFARAYSRLISSQSRASEISAVKLDSLSSGLGLYRAHTWHEPWPYRLASGLHNHPVTHVRPADVAGIDGPSYDLGISELPELVKL